MTEIYFFDTYAIIENAKKNPSYRRFAHKGFICTRLNQFELATFLLRAGIEESPLMDTLERSIEELDASTITHAARFWKKYRKRRVSMTDCIGYTIALQRNIPFVTGDRAFEDLPNVLFVR